MGLVEEMAAELFKKIPATERCPDLRLDDTGAYCGHDLPKGKSPEETRRLVCDLASLQLWCLTKGDYSKCIYHQGKPFPQDRQYH